MWLCAHASFEPFYAMRVCKNFAGFVKRLPNVIPAIYRWNVPTNICAGSILSWKFPILVEGLKRFAIPPEDISLHQPASAKVLAKALGAFPRKIGKHRYCWRP